MRLYFVPLKETILKEMSQGLGLDEAGSDSASASEEEGDDAVTRRGTKMKTKKQKRKRKEILKEVRCKIVSSRLRYPIHLGAVEKVMWLCICLFYSLQPNFS